MRPTRRIAVITVLVLLVLSVIWSALPTGAQEPQPPSNPALVGFPDKIDNSGKFVNVTRGLSSLGDVGEAQNVINISLQVDPTLTEFTLEIFDGDMGGDWDRWWDPQGICDCLKFTLYKDPDVNAQGGPEDLLYTWPASDMPDSGWCTLNPAYDFDNPDPNEPVCKAGAKITQDPGAYNAGREASYYHLVAEWVNPEHDDEQNNFKVSVEGVPFLLAGSTIGFEGFSYHFHGGGPWCGCPEYDGEFTFYFLVPDSTGAILLYDGDADLRADTNDANSPSLECRGPYVGSVDHDGDGVPDTSEDPDGDPSNGPWYMHAWDTGLQQYVPVCGFPPFQSSPQTFAEDAIQGSPPDDTAYRYFKVPPPVYYDVSSPGGVWTVTNSNVSGDQEWEVFKIGLDAGSIPDPDVTVPTMSGGLYKWHFIGLDSHNTMFMHTGFDLFPQLATLGNTVWVDTLRDGIWDLDGADDTLGTDDDEPGIPNVKINLYRDADGDQTLSDGDELLGSQWTDATGYYIFTDLDWADYIVQVDPDNFAAGGPLEGMVQTPVNYPADAPDHHNRVTPWPVHIPISLNYVKADFGYVTEGDFCVWDPDDPDNGATGEWWIETADEQGPTRITIVTTLARSFADTAWGPNSLATGWPGQGRRFKHIWTSDNLELELLNGNGEVVMQLGIDLLEPDASAPSGYATAGVTGGDGYFVGGNLAHVLAYDTSVSRNLNDHVGLGQTDPCYWNENNCPVVSVLDDGTYESPCDDWIWDTWYTITIDYAAFGDSGFGGAIVTALHSSPSKTGEEKPNIDPCPPDWRDWLY